VDETIGRPIQGVVLIHAEADTRFERALEDRYLDLLRLATLLARDTTEAQDALQAALERAWRSRDQLDDQALLGPWLKKILVREVVRRQTSAWNRLVRPATPVDLSPLVGTRSGDDLHVDLLQALARLPVAQRVAVVLHHYAGYQIDEVSAIVGAPAETVRSRLRLAMSSLRMELAQ
jgi:RNA polymerase sigma-70 factor (ECF subfamily)